MSPQTKSSLKPPPQPPYAEPQGLAAAELHHISPFDLHVDENYQRTLNSHMIKGMLANFDPALFGVIEVNFRDDNTLYVMDGQHRVHVARQLNLPAVPVKMHFGLTSEQEAEIFLRFQRRRRPVTQLESYKAALHAKDPDYVCLDALLHRMHFRVGTPSTPSSLMSRSIQAVATVVKIYRYDDGKLLARVLTVYDAAWGRVPGQLQGSLMLGLAYLLSRKGGELEDKKLIAKLATVMPQDVLRLVRSTTNASGSTVVGQVAMTLLHVYNRGRRTNIVDGSDLRDRLPVGQGGLTEVRPETERMGTTSRGARTLRSRDAVAPSIADV